MTDRMALQRAEFDALTELVEQRRRLSMTMVVDDDYPEVRHQFEGALKNYIDAMKANGRFEQGNRYGVELTCTGENAQLQSELRALMRQRDDLLEANNQYLERARTAEQRLALPFAEAWKAMEARGYQYGPSALDNVRTGYELAVGKRED